MVNEINQTEEDKYCMISHSCVESKKAELIETGRMVVTRGWRQGRGSEKMVFKHTDLQLVNK